MIETISGWLQGVLLPGFGTLLLAAALGLVRRYVGKIEDERLRQLILELVQAAEQIFGLSERRPDRSVRATVIPGLSGWRTDRSARAKVSIMCGKGSDRHGGRM